MSSKAQRRGSDYCRKRKRFHANQCIRKVSDTLDVYCISASAKKFAKKIILTRNTLTTFKSSSVIASSKDYEINTRITYDMRTVELGFCGVKNFCTAMDLPPPVSQKSYERILRKINLASHEVADDSMKNAAKEKYQLLEVTKSVSVVTVRGKHANTPHVLVCSVIGDVTGKVIDVAVLSSYCKGCEKWRGPKSGHSYEERKLKHQPHCVTNHIGSSNKMKVDGMKEIFQRSVPQRNAKYIKYIGNGDTKTFQELQRTAPYSIEKVECVGHIQKRMGSRLRKLKTMNRGKKLSDGRCISGKNRLTDTLIDTITTYYHHTDYSYNMQFFKNNDSDEFFMFLNFFDSRSGNCFFSERVTC
ncbi:uncharacterized protein TNCV_3617011 [Trichonephila clavipes]|nr:uncharacterized protein TNCV_3617011 [Trichonephila clavipes]